MRRGMHLVLYKIAFNFSLLSSVSFDCGYNYHYEI